MQIFHKLKPATLGIGSIIGITISLYALLLMVAMGLFLVFALVALITFSYGFLIFLIFIRTKNFGFLVFTLFLFTCSALSVSVLLFGFHPIYSFNSILGIFFIVFGIWVLVLLFSRKLTWRSREILELAALPVDETKAGFTERPLPVGKISSSGTEIQEFARFLHKHLIAIPYFENGSVVISVNSKLTRQVGILTDYLDTTWVRFDRDGNVSVYISRTDYLKYKDALSFDQLCASLGKLFIEFYEHFSTGDSNRIIERINTMQIHPISR